MLKIRIYSPQLPYPVSEGAYQVIFEQILGFAQYHQVELVTWKDSKDEFQKKLGGRTFAEIFGKNVTLTHWAPVNGVEQIFRRVRRTLKSIFKPDSSTGLFYYPPEQDLRETLGTCDVAIYHYTYAWSWLRHAKNTKEMKRILYFHNIESDLHDYRAGRELKPFQKWIHRQNAKKSRFQEEDLENYVQAFWHISPKDFTDTVLKNIGVKVDQAVKVPIYRDQYFQKRSSDFLKQYKSNNPVSLGFIGGLDFEANRASLDWLLDQVCPELQKRKFSGILEVVGRGAPPELILKMKNFSFVHYEGFRKDLDSFWNQMSVMLVPHVVGSGVRIKLLDALGSGIPAIANDQVVERIHPDLESSPFLFQISDPQEWIEFIMKLEGQKLRFELQKHGLDRVHTFEAVYPEFVS